MGHSRHAAAWRRARRAVLAAVVACTAALGVVAVQPPPAHAAPAPTGRAAPADLPDSIGMDGYQIFEVPVDTTGTLRGIYAQGYNAQVAGMMGVDGAPGVPQPWVWAPGADYQQLDTLGTTSLVHIGGFDGKGNLWGSQEDPATLEDKLLEWTWNGGAWSWKPLPVLGGGVLGHNDQGKPIGVTVNSVDRRGDVLMNNNVIRRYDGSLLQLGGGRADVLAEDGGAWGFALDGSPLHWRPGTGAPDALNAPPGFIQNDGDLQAVGVSDDGHLAVHQWGGDTQGRLRDPDGTWHVLKTPTGGVFIPWGMTDGGEIDGPVSRDGLTLDVLTQAGKREVFASQLLRYGSTWSFNTENPAQVVSRGGGFSGYANHDGSLVAYEAIPIDPLVFVHGAGASELAEYTGPDTPGSDLWLSCANPNRKKLSLFPSDIASGDAPADSGAVDALRHAWCGIFNEYVNPALDVYGTLFDTITGSGSYREYQVNGKRSRQTGAGCDTSQMAEAPDFFVYSYDWRRDNEKNAAGLADYVNCVKQFWPDRKLDVLTHSMGSLVARRYMLRHPTDPVARLITIGAPWLGAPKLVNVLETGDFAPQPVNGFASDIKYIVGSFPAAQQLMASAIYTDQASSVPVFREDGWDINGDGTASQVYDYKTLSDFLDATVPGNPGTTANLFQSVPGQTDWSFDNSGVQYTSIVGLRAGADSIGTVVAKNSLVCDWNGDGIDCHQLKHIEQEFVCGDGTVPLISAQRAGRGHDWNAPNQEVLTFSSPDAGGNQSVEHTGLASNPAVEEAIFERLFSFAPPSNAPVDHSGLGKPNADTQACLHTQSQPSSGQVSLAAQKDTIDPGDALRYVTLLGGTDLTVASSDNQSTDSNGPTGGWVTGVTVHPSDVPDAGQATLPLDVPTTYHSTFTASGDPIQLTLLEGSQQHPTAATRWVDVAAAKGTAMELTSSADGTDVLRKDTNGDGTPDAVVAPTTRLTGADALDQTAPTLSGQTVTDGTGTQVALSADDGPNGTGVTRIVWSTDGSHFQVYDGPFDVAPDATITAFAEDRAGNRSAPQTFAVAGLHPAMLTIATLTPAPTGAGWSPGKVAVHMTASAPAGSSPVASVHVATTGAQETAETTTDGSSADITVSAAGATTVTFGAVAADGTREPDRTVVVRVDLADPSAGISTPGESAVVDSLPALRGIADDDASGVARVQVRLQNGAGKSWDGSAWKDAAAWLTTSGSGTWQRTTGLPAGDDLPRGGYRVTLRVTDNAGRTTTTQAVPFTVAPSAALTVREFPVGPDTTVQSSASAVSARGVAAGVVSAAGTTDGVRWDARGMTRLTAPQGTSGASPTAVDDTGQVWGSAGTSRGNVAVRWAPDGTATLLPAARPEDITSGVTAVDRTGTWAVGGESPGQLGVQGTAVRWGPAGPEELGVPNGWDHVVAAGVASDGTAYGTAYPPPFSTTVARAVSWGADGRPHLLAELNDGDSSSITAVSSTGQAVGIEGERTLVRWVDGVPTLVGSDVSAVSITPNGISDDGTVVGEYTTSRGSTQAFLARPGGSVEDLTAQLPAGSGWSLVRARGVDANGQIVGFGMHGSARRAFAVSATHAPVTDDTSVATPEGVAVDVALGAWDPDAGESLTVAVTRGPAHGTGTLSGTTLHYTPSSGFSGTDTVTYQATDASGLTSVPGTVTVKVGDGQAQQDAAPVATGISVTTDAGAPVPVPLSATDPDGDPLSYVVTAQPAHGTLTGTAPDLVYTPDAGFTGDDAFTWHASDGTLDSAAATTQVTVNRVEHAPEVSLQAPAAVAEGGQLSVSAPASDADGDPLTWAWSVDGQTVAGATGDTVTTPAGDGPADRSVTVTVTDGTLSVSRRAVVHVDDLAPTVQAGPAVSTPWGVPAALHGTATDPSAADTAAGLSPIWDLGDGSTTPGADVTHTWAAAGTYTARLTATDKDGLSGSSATTVTVTRRPTTVRLVAGGTFGFATATALVYDTVWGTPLAGRQVVLTVDGVAQPALSTGADGSAALPVGGLLPGSHTVSAQVTADDRYDAGSVGPVTGSVTITSGVVTGAVGTGQGEASFSVRSDGGTVQGILGWHGSANAVDVSVQVTALGVAADGGGAWFGGVTADGKHRLLAYVEDHGSSGGRDVFRLWVDGVERTTTGQVASGNVVIHHDPGTGGARNE